jgi:cellulose synthase (UDP-forming)
MCGTNMVIRRRALERAGGMAEHNIAEDFLTSLFIHRDGWKSTYVPEVLAEGLAPEDFLSYYKQQFRWSRGSLEVVFRHNPLFMRGLTWPQKIEYLSSASYHLAGPVVLMNALLPAIFFFTGLTPLRISTMALATVFLPYIFLMIYTLQRSSNFSYTFRALSFSMGSFPIQIKALWAVMTRQKSAFSVTSKTRLSGNFLNLAAPHILYILIAMAGVGLSFLREGLAAQVINNLAWSLFNVAVFLPFIIAASPWGAKSTEFLRGPESEPAVPEYKPYINTAAARTRAADINYLTHHEHENDI